MSELKQMMPASPLGVVGVSRFVFKFIVFIVQYYNKYN